MDLSLSSSRSGSPTCAAGELWLHSRYDPEREALRFAQTELASAKPSHVVLLGPCLDYLSGAVRSLLPGARIVVVQHTPFFAQSSGERADAVWHPGLGTSLEAFLDAALDENAISGVAVLEWEPATQAFPQEARAAREALRESLERLASSTATVKASGRRWIANACTAFLLVERCCLPEPSSLPVVVAAAGPSLRPSLEILRGLEGRFLLLAVSSALAACRSAGMEPDLVVSTDGGYWSRLHLYPLAGKALPLASPLTALPSSSICRRTALLLLDQGSFAEAELLSDLGRAVKVPPHGTVSGTAIQLAARLSAGPIVTLGLDLASLGDRDHASPHGFEPLLEKAVSRIAPMEGSLWSRSLDTSPLPQAPWRSSRSHSTYAGALSLDSAALGGRLFRIGASPVVLRGFEDIEAVELRGLLSGGRSGGLELKELALPARDERESRLRGRIEAWRSLAADAAAGLCQGKLPESALVEELLRSIDIVDYAAARRATLAGGDARGAAAALAEGCERFLSALQRRFAP